MAKTKRLRFHKIIIHKNRWLAWAISFSVIAGIALVGYIKVVSETFDTSDIPAISKASDNWQQYTNAKYGFSVNFPKDWSEQQTKFTVSFGAKTDLQEKMAVNVKDGSKEPAARSSLEGFNQRQLTVAGVIASEFSPSKATNSQDKYILIPHRDKLFVIISSSKYLDQILASFTFTNE